MTGQSHQRRREILDRLRSSETIGPGPMVAGLQESDRIVVTSLYSPYACQRLRHSLAAAGVRSWTRKKGATTSVEVSYGNRELARRIVANQRSEDPDRRPSSTRGALDFTILGGIIGAVIGVASFSYPLQLLFASSGGQDSSEAGSLLAWSSIASTAAIDTWDVSSST